MTTSRKIIKWTLTISSARQFFTEHLPRSEAVDHNFGAAGLTKTLEHKN